MQKKQKQKQKPTRTISIKFEGKSLWTYNSILVKYKNKKKNLTAEYFVDIIEEKTNLSSKVDAIGIKKYIKALKPYCKKIINLLYFQGFTQAEASEELDMPLGTIKTRNRNCMNKLREILTT